MVRQVVHGGKVRRGGQFVGQFADADGRYPVTFGQPTWGGRYPFTCGTSMYGERRRPVTCEPTTCGCPDTSCVQSQIGGGGDDRTSEPAAIYSVSLGSRDTAGSNFFRGSEGT
ncbi:unnamed protein product [Macrosiphum euphorbiae]|uniref:Uncharacterized protein n=1 Tax=Macrosiphum euphorbiae TaxID=13131 RepID=A0AAV0X3S7_9HEMI|nr:unnamed protein product [Macrosiphum euphorbiae]